jgi:hypothetical protein
MLSVLIQPIGQFQPQSPELSSRISTDSSSSFFFPFAINEMVKHSNTVEVIGAGYGRTGTNSFKKALEILGYNPTYHMYEIFMNNPTKVHGEFWIRVADRQPYDFDEVFCQNGKPRYRATCDFPAAQYWKEQLEQYPEAKVILTIRDPEKWYKSVMDTIFQAISGSPYQYFGLYFLDMIGMGRVQPEFFEKTICRDAFKNRFDKESVIASYNEHNESVKRECPKDKLLVFNVEEGWEPLCAFLNKPIPAEPFPRGNDTQEFLGHLRKGNMIGYTMMAVITLVPLGIGLVATYWWKITDQTNVSIRSPQLLHSS